MTIFKNKKNKKARDKIKQRKIFYQVMSIESYKCLCVSVISVNNYQIFFCKLTDNLEFFYSTNRSIKFYQKYINDSNL